MKIYSLIILLSTNLIIANISYGQTIFISFDNHKFSKIYYEEFGDGTPIIILHRASSGYLEPIFEGTKGWKRIYIDPPGIGKSSVDDWVNNADDCLEIIYAAILELVPRESFSLVGFSYFGYMARGILAKDPNRVSGMALICPVVIPPNNERTLPTQTKQYVDKEFFNHLPNEKKKLLENFVVKTPSSLQAFEKLKGDDVLMNVEFWNRIKQNGYSLSFNPDSLTFEKPALILLGLQDDVVGFTDALRLSQVMPRASIVALDFASHSLPYEQNHLMNIHILEWLNRLRYYINYKND